MEIKRINSILINLVEFDRIPLYKILQASGATDIQAKYNFSSVEINNNPQNQPKIIFLLGTYNNQTNTQEFIIKRLEIEERKIVIDVDGASQIADDFFIDFIEYLKKLSGNENFDLPIVVQSRESEIVSKLKFSAANLISPKLLKYIETSVVDKAHHPQGKAVANLAAVAFRIDYISTDEKLKDYRISLSRKEFLIAPRDGTPLDEQIFVSKVPVDTSTHLAILEELEEIYS